MLADALLADRLRLLAKETSGEPPAAGSDCICCSPSSSEVFSSLSGRRLALLALVWSVAGRPVSRCPALVRRSACPSSAAGKLGDGGKSSVSWPVRQLVRRKAAVRIELAGGAVQVAWRIVADSDLYAKGSIESEPDQPLLVWWVWRLEQRGRAGCCLERRWLLVTTRGASARASEQLGREEPLAAEPAAEPVVPSAAGADRVHRYKPTCSLPGRRVSCRVSVPREQVLATRCADSHWRIGAHQDASDEDSRRPAAGRRRWWGRTESSWCRGSGGRDPNEPTDQHGRGSALGRRMSARRGES